MSNKQSYRELCRRVSLPLFSRDWWLDAVAGPEAWDAALVRDKTRIVACVPYVVRKVFPFRLLTMPRLTPRIMACLKDVPTMAPPRALTEKADLKMTPRA